MPRFQASYDIDLPPSAPHNQRVAEYWDLVYDPKQKAFVDKEGCPIRDKYFQPL
jgi:hypothetical protein